MNSVRIRLEGKYLDSYLYSGALFLIHQDSRMTTYKFEDLITMCFSGKDLDFLRGVFFDSRKLNNQSTCFLENEQEKDYYISLKDINSQELSEVELGVWPTDLDIASNILFISSDKGVESRRIHWDSGRVSGYDEAQSVYDKKVFQVSVGHHGRLLMAAGINGAIEVINVNQKKAEQRNIHESFWIGCEWSGDSSRAVLRGIEDHKFISFKTPDYAVKKQMSSTDWEAIVEDVKNSEPNYLESDSDVISSWIDDNIFYFMDKNFSVYRRNDESVEKILDLKEGEKSLDLNTLIQSRSFDYGFLAEDHDSLYFIKDKKASIMAEKPVSWRVYPKAKNYRNHAHVVMDEVLDIYGFLP